MAASTSATRTQRSLEDKLAIIKSYDEIKGTPGAKSKIVAKYNLPSISTLNRMLETKDRLNKSVESNFNVKRKRFIEGKYPELDQKLYDWFLRMRSNSVELTGDLLLEQAKQLFKDGIYKH